MVRRRDVPVNPTTIELKADGCSEMELRAYPDGKISGKIVDARGRAYVDVSVRLWSAERIDDVGRWWGGNETNDRGEFQEETLPPGKYVIGVYIWAPGQERTLDSKPTLWFYPGVKDPKGAKPISLGFAQHLSGIRFVVPETR